MSQTIFTNPVFHPLEVFLQLFLAHGTHGYVCRILGASHLLRFHALWMAPSTLHLPRTNVQQHTLVCVSVRSGGARPTMAMGTLRHLQRLGRCLHIVTHP